jgi:hypothetical protein
LPNNPKAYCYVGNTMLDGFKGILYFASRNGNLIFITGLDVEGRKILDTSLADLTDKYLKSQTQIDDSGLRKFPAGTCTLGPDSDYQGELKVGDFDHRGYFEIVSMQ